MDPARLGVRAAKGIARADRLAIPTIVLWETALLVRKRKLELEMTIGEWARQVLSIPRLVPLPLTAEIALLADSLVMHADPVDRFVVATALHHRVPLVTKDALLRSLKMIDTMWS